MERDPKSYNVRAVERAIQILSAFDGEHAEQGVSELAQTTGLPKATAHRIIMTLFNTGFLERTSDGEKFRLGLPLVGLGLGVLRRLDVRRKRRDLVLCSGHDRGTRICCKNESGEADRRNRSR